MKKQALTSFGRLMLVIVGFCLALSILILYQIECAYAEQLISPPQILEVTWSYTDDITELAGFRFYRDGALVCDINNPSARTANCTDSIPYGVDNNYFIAAYNLEGIEGALSDPFVFAYHARIPGRASLSTINKKR